MNIIPWRKGQHVPVTREATTWPAMTEFRREMDRLFDRFFAGSWMEPWWRAEEFERPPGELIPSIDVAEKDDRIIVRAEIPGMEPDDIDISVSDNMLTIHGEKSESKDVKHEDFSHIERRFGTFSRCIELPPTADLDKIDAEQKNGVLTITVRKLSTAKAKKIAVKPSEKKKLTPISA